MKKTDNKNKVIIRLAQAYEQGETSVIERIESILIPSQKELPEELQKIYDDFGDNPIDEKEFYEIEKLIDAKLHIMKDVGIDKYPASDVSTLITLVINKVSGILQNH